MPGEAGTVGGLASTVSEGLAYRQLLHGISGTARSLRQRSDCWTVRRKKKLSKRYQRFLERKAFLERKGLLRRCRVKEMEGPGDHPVCLGGSSNVQQEVTEEPSVSGMNGNCTIFPTALQTLPRTESTKPTLPASSKRDHLAIPHPPESPGSWLSAPIFRRRQLGGFSSSATKCVAIDCEMVGTGPRGCLGEVARCSIVNYHGVVIYDKYVKPSGPITDYRTRWSGIRKHHMTGAIEFDVAQREIMKILKGKVVVGHALHNDFKVLKYFHPRSLRRDTSKMPLLKKVAGFPVRGSVSLKSLAKQLLNKSIQVGWDGHCSVEDAYTSMQLYRLVEARWEQKLHKKLLTKHDHTTSDASSEISHYMDDQYWPAELQEELYSVGTGPSIQGANIDQITLPTLVPTACVWPTSL
ncbi:apoptosis-enhancing nuclease-like [Narcine bancroftii]|uniref:apoptosis-enhancing nuclease-like n=1 Tax=Narcine bancroftii TaxID=1343680 RepID=UPI0038311231